MVLTSIIDITDLKDELTNFFRWVLYSLDDKSREIRTSQTFTATAGQTVFDLTYGSRIRFVETITVDGTTLYYGTDFSVDFRGTNKGRITLTTGATVGDEVIITYGYSNQYTLNSSTKQESAMVYPDFPRPDLGISQYTRVGIGVMKPSAPGGLGGEQNVMVSNPRISLLILTENTYLLDQFQEKIEEYVAKYSKRFYNFRYIYVENVANIELSEDITADVVARNIDLIIPDRYEVTSYV